MYNIVALVDLWGLIGRITLFEELSDAGVVRQRCGISRPTPAQVLARHYQGECEAGIGAASRQERGEGGA